jgi:hypothetical protein
MPGKWFRQLSIFDGVLGSTFMKRYIIEINYKKKKMSFYDPKTYRYNDKTYEKIKIQFIKQLPMAEGFIIVNGKKHKGKYEFDTGSDDGLTMSTPFTSNIKPNNLIHTPYYDFLVK